MIDNQMHSDHTHHQGSDAWIGVICALLAFVVLLLIPVEVATDGWSQFANARATSFFPLWTGGLLLFLSVGLVVRSLRACGGSQSPRLWMPLRVILAAGALGVSAAAIFWLGFVPAAAAMIVALSLIFGERRIIFIVLLAILVPLAIHVLFRGLLNVLLPTGLF